MLKRNRTPPVCTITRTKHARLRRSGYSYYVAAWDQGGGRFVADEVESPETSKFNSCIVGIFLAMSIS